MFHNGCSTGRWWCSFDKLKGVEALGGYQVGFTTLSGAMDEGLVSDMLDRLFTRCLRANRRQQREARERS
jgi:hypothetical protein